MVIWPAIGRPSSGREPFEAAPAAFDKSNRSGAFYLLPFVVTYRFDLVR